MDDKFRPKAPVRESLETKTPEYSFNEGVVESLVRIKRLFRKLKRHVFVTICGSGTDVGKSALLGALGKGLISSGIPIQTVRLDFCNPETKTVIFSTTQGSTWVAGIKHRDEVLRKNSDLKIDGSFADFYIGIYRPDKKFSGPPGLPGVADIVIRNEYAKDNPDKLR